MPKRERLFHPFDVTYSEVSRRTRDWLRVEVQQRSISDKEAAWLKSLMWSFQIESDLWGESADLKDYIKIMKRLDVNILMLSAAAYLHIAYDLPRVLAKHWPGAPPNKPPTLSEGMRIYNRIGQTFSDVIDDVRFMPEVVGYAGPMLRWKEARRVMQLWVVDLRGGAWEHAQLLQEMPLDQQDIVKKAMLNALTDALKQLSNFTPWRALNLTRPDDAFYGVVIKSVSLATVLASVQYGLDKVIWSNLPSIDQVVSFMNGSVILFLVMAIIIGGFFWSMSSEERHPKMIERRPNRKKNRYTKKEEETRAVEVLDSEVADAVRIFGNDIKYRLDKIFAEYKSGYNDGIKT